MMRYLLITHVPLGRGSGRDAFEVGDLWLEDLGAQAKAIAAAGMELMVATPLAEKLDPLAGGSFNTKEITPEDYGFSYHPLPFYLSARQYLRVRYELGNRLAEAISQSDIVQADYGGHPVALGKAAWPIAGRLKKKRIWVFDGADPFPRLALHADEARNPIKRWLKKGANRRLEAFCRDAVREADLVFAHNRAVVERFKDVWGPNCHQFDRSFVTDAIVIDATEILERQRRIVEANAPLRMVAAGRQIAIKGTDHVLRAMRQALDRGARLELTVMGDGEDLPRFQALASELKLNEFVRFSGSVPYGSPLFDIWAKSHIMLITNLTAEISRNVLLSMARGLPPVMYANPGTDELVRQCGAGVIVPRGNVAALAAAMEFAAKQRADLANKIPRGVESAGACTLEKTHQRRAALAAALVDEVAQPVTARAAAVAGPSLGEGILG
jgi:glycosyltransferase involved in cell wall biosynthesis